MHFGARIVSAIRFAAGDAERGVVAPPEYEEGREVDDRVTIVATLDMI
jgi:hypothetical protein